MVNRHHQTVHPSTQYLLNCFAVDHLPEHLRVVSQPFHDLAHAMVARDMTGPDVSAGLRKLMEAKDCFVRAAAIATRSQ